jgi:hypothetical protein
VWLTVILMAPFSSLRYAVLPYLVLFIIWALDFSRLSLPPGGAYLSCGMPMGCLVFDLFDAPTGTYLVTYCRYCCLSFFIAGLLVFFLCKGSLSVIRQVPRCYSFKNLPASPNPPHFFFNGKPKRNVVSQKILFVIPCLFMTVSYWLFYARKN